MCVEDSNYKLKTMEISKYVSKCTIPKYMFSHIAKILY